MNLFVRMMRGVYGVTGPVQEAHPHLPAALAARSTRPTLGGRACARWWSRPSSPAVLVEEQAIEQGLSEAVSGPLEAPEDLLEEPVQEGMYDSSLRDNPSVPPPATLPSRRGKGERPRRPGGGGGGTAAVHPLPPDLTPPVAAEQGVKGAVGVLDERPG